jgi:hypothetical protein
MAHFLFSILLGAAWCLAERSQETNRCKLNQKREKEKEKERHYLMTKKLERIKYGPKSYKERERRRDCHLKILKIPPFYYIKFLSSSSMSVVSGFTTNNMGQVSFDFNVGHLF